jgi:hypothetical protein
VPYGDAGLFYLMKDTQKGGVRESPHSFKKRKEEDDAA